ncbi:MAG: nitrous oxide-stimulated promoter family protein [Clostridia bacterium]|nr:nitrous oxide-stimulated promoter family protein [Clostridia bacterium]
MNKDISIIVKFIATYCKHNHIGEEKIPFTSPFPGIKDSIELCKDCTSLASYSIQRKFNCPQKNKVSCKKCPTKCYHQDYRTKIKSVMKFSGMYYIKRGRIDFLLKYFF